MKKIFRHWKPIYLVCTLLYMGWVTTVGSTEFERINSQYRRLVAALDAARITATAVAELTAERCRKAAVAPGDETNCNASLSPPVLAAREKQVEVRLREAKNRGFVKIVLFYSGFTVIFLLGPPLFLYLVLAGGIRILKSIKFVRD